MFGNGFRARVGAAFCAASSAGFHLYCVPSASPLRHDCMIVWNVLASSHDCAFPPPITSPKGFQQVLSCVCFPSELMREADARCKPEKRRSSWGGARGLTMAALPKPSFRKRAFLVGVALVGGARRRRRRPRRLGLDNKQRGSQRGTHQGSHPGSRAGRDRPSTET